MDIYEPENEFYGLIGRPKITAVQPYSSSTTRSSNSSSTTKDIVIHFNNDDYTEQGEQSNEEMDTKAFIVKQEVDSVRANDENYIQSHFVDLNYGVGNNGKKVQTTQSAFQLDQGNSQPGFYQNSNNGQQGNVVFNTNVDGNGQSSFNNGNKQYQILQERGVSSSPQQRQNIPNVRYDSNFSQQQTAFNTTTGAYENGLNNAYQTTAITTSSNSPNDNTDQRYQFQQPMISQPYNNSTHAANGIYQTANQDFQGQHVAIKTEIDNGQNEAVINNAENHDQTDERSNDGDKPLEPELDAEGKGSVVCPICGVTYSKYYYNLKHRFFHSGKKYDCTICGRSFNHQHNMYRHKRVHEDVNDYQFRCDEDSCEMLFKTQTGLKRHMQMKHSISSTGNNNNVHYSPQNFKEVNPAPAAKKRRRKRKGVELVESVPNNTTPTSAAPSNTINPTNAITNNFQQQMFTQSGLPPVSSPAPTSNPTQMMAANLSQISNNPPQMSGNQSQMSSNPLQMAGNPPQMLSNGQQMSGNPNQMAGNPNHMPGNVPQQMPGNHAQMVQMLDPGKPVNQQYFDPNRNQQFNLVQNPAMSQNSYNNNNNNKNFEELKSVTTSQAMTSLPIPNQNFGNPTQAMMQMIPGRVPMMQQNPQPGYVTMDRSYQQSYINNENQNLERTSPYTEYQVPHHSTDLHPSNEPSAHNGNKTTAVRCHICDKDFSVHYIREHLDHHAGRRYTCYICGLVFLSRDRLKRHKNQHTNKNEYDPYCVRCKLYFPSEKKLAFHIRKIHDSEQMKSSRILQREGAKKKAKTSSNDGQTDATESIMQNIAEEGVTVDLERKIQVGKKIYFKCKYCNGCFKSKRNRNKHELMHEELGGPVNVNSIEGNMVDSKELQPQNFVTGMHMLIKPDIQADHMEQEEMITNDDSIKQEFHMNNMGQGMHVPIKQEFQSMHMQPEIANPQGYPMNNMKQEYPGQLTQEFQSNILPYKNASPVKQEFHPIENLSVKPEQGITQLSNLEQVSYQITENSCIKSEEMSPIDARNEVKSPQNQNAYVDQSNNEGLEMDTFIKNEEGRNVGEVNNVMLNSSMLTNDYKSTNNNNTMTKDTNDNNDIVDSNVHDTPSEVKTNEDDQNQGTVQKDMHKCPYCDSIFKKDIVLNRHISMHLKKIQK